MKELIWPVTTSTLTTVVVFAPLSLLTGVVGQFFSALSITLSIAVIVSLVLALTLIPVLAESLLEDEQRGLARGTHRIRNRARARRACRSIRALARRGAAPSTPPVRRSGRAPRRRLSHQARGGQRLSSRDGRGRVRRRLFHAGRHAACRVGPSGKHRRADTGERARGGGNVAATGRRARHFSPRNRTGATSSCD